MNYLEKIIEDIKVIETDSLSNKVDRDIKVDITEEQKVYYWIRVFLKDENPNIEIGDDIIFTYEPSGETITTKFICYNKKGLDKDIVDQIKNYNPEDDKKTLCLMVDEKLVNDKNDIPFIRTLFTFSKHYQEVVYRRTDLVLTTKDKDIILDYFDITF
jgi:hypothetical protein